MGDAQVSLGQGSPQETTHEKHFVRTQLPQDALRAEGRKPASGHIQQLQRLLVKTLGLGDLRGILEGFERDFGGI